MLWKVLVNAGSCLLLRRPAKSKSWDSCHQSVDINACIAVCTLCWRSHVLLLSLAAAAAAGALTYQDLGINPMKVTEGLPIEAVRYQRVGGYSYGDTKTLAKSLPANVKRYWGMGNQ